MLKRTDFEKEMRLVASWLQEYFKKIEEYPVKSQVGPREIFKKFSDKIPVKGSSTEEILTEITHKILPGITHWQHPNFHAYFTANSSTESVLAETVMSGLSAQCMMWATSPAAAELEEKVLNWLKKPMNIPSSWHGVIQDTASTATLAAILTAREKATDFQSNLRGVPNNLRVYCSTETHSSIDKAVAISGIGTDNLIKISVNSDLSMNTDNLKKAIIKDIKNGYKPTCVVSALGTTGTVSIDSVSEISTICKEYEIWHHIDAAYAGTALILPEYHKWIDGIEDAESFVFNPHKWLFTNFDCTVYYVKNKEFLIRTFEAIPEYLKTGINSSINNYKDWGVPLGRRFRALKLWWVIKSYGLENIQNKLRKHIQLSEYFVKKVSANNEFEFPVSPILNFCCLRWIPPGFTDQQKINDMNSTLLEYLNTQGKIYISHTKINDNYVLRFVFGQTYLEKRHVDKTYHTLMDAIEVQRHLL
jgi:aromatic-L-amino-acid decarboxylase